MKKSITTLSTLLLLSGFNMPAQASLCEHIKGDVNEQSAKLIIPGDCGGTGGGSGGGTEPPGEPEPIVGEVYDLEAVDSYMTQFMGTWDEEIEAKCPNDMFLTGVYSQHHNYYEDRKFKLICTEFQTKATNELASIPVTRNSNVDKREGPNNPYDEDVEMTCPRGEFIVGFWSRHENNYEDRTFDYICSAMKVNGNAVAAYTSLNDCSWTNLNEWDMEFTQNASHGAFIGVESEHDNYKEDRQTKFEYCGSVYEF